MDESNNRHYRILAVDDEEIILDLYKNILSSDREFHSKSPSHAQKQSGAPTFEVICCTQGDQAVEIVKQSLKDNSPFAVVFLDLNMPPGPDGEWTAEQIQKIDPYLNIVLVTGYLTTNLGNRSNRSAESNKLLYLQKPFHRQEIIQFAFSLSAKWQAELKLRALHAELEGLVEQRTAALQKSNQQLIIEIESRKQVQQELQDSLDNLKKMVNGTIQAIALTVEIRDPYTSGHQQRVADLARAVAEEMGLAPDQIEGIYMAAAIHDIGKISLPAEILAKPIQLTDIELRMIQAHSQAGYDVLKGIDFPWPIAQIVLQHHERIDGSGYPQGLSGADILLEARIIGVADVIETMASHRPYRPSVGMDKALEEISKKRGVLYDPVVVDACLRVLTQKGFEFRKL